MDKFIYVFSSNDKELLQSMGFVLIKSDEPNSTFVFKNQNQMKFSKLDISYITSNTLTF